MKKRIKKKINRLLVMRRIALVLGSNQRAKTFMRASLRMAENLAARFPFTQFCTQQIANAMVTDYFFTDHTIEDRPTDDLRGFIGPFTTDYTIGTTDEKALDARAQQVETFTRLRSPVETDVCSVEDPMWGGYMESDAHLRKRIKESRGV